MDGSAIGCRIKALHAALDRVLCPREPTWVIMISMTSRLRQAAPTVISAASMWLGLLSCVLAAAGRVEAAAWVIIYCGFLDKLDGIIARALRVSSPFGMEMDSFSDFTAFGVAPALLIWFAASGPSGVPDAWVAASAFSFPFLAAIRLARFNLVTHADPECFTGVPTTFAALLFAALFLTARDLQMGEMGSRFLVAVMPGLAVLMVTRLRIPKLKPRRSRAFNAFQWTAALAVLVVSVLRVLPELPLAVGAGYLFIGALAGRRMGRCDEPSPSSPA